MGFTDTLPSGLVIAAAPNVSGTCTGGTVTAAAGSGTITVAGKSVPASGVSSPVVPVASVTTGASFTAVTVSVTATCDENCAKTWRPYIAPVGALPSGYWDVDTRPDGTKQWAYKGFALYTYAPDKPGDIGGNEIYDLAPVGDDGTVASNGRQVQLVTGAGVDPIVPPGGDVSGVGVGAMFWHAVVP